MKDLFSLNRFLLAYKGRLLAGFVFVAASNIFAVYPAEITRRIIDTSNDFFAATAKGADAGKIHEQLLWLLFLLLGATLLKGICMYFMRQSLIVMSRWIEYDLKNEIYLKLQKLPLSFYRKSHTGDIMARMSEDVSNVRMYVGPSIMYLMNLLVMAVVVIYAMFRVNAQLALWVLMPLPVLSVLVYTISRVIQRQSMRIQSQVGSLSTLSQETFSGIRVIQALAAEPASQSKMKNESDLYFRYSTKQVLIEALYQPAISLLIGCSVILTVLVGGIQVTEGQITTGNIAEFILYVNMLTWPFTSLGWVSALIQKATASMRRINRLLEAPEAPLQELPSEMDAGKAAFSLHKVSLSFTGRNSPVLKNVSLEIPAGSSLGITGKTGSGKTTLIHLLAGFYTPDSGTLSFNGFPVQHFNIPSLRANSGIVTQDTFLFSDTIYNNLTFASSDVSFEEVTRAAHFACLHETIMKFELQYSSMLGERGINLSGGQRQRLSIARAVLPNPTLLIMDDALSALDTKTENEIIGNLKTLKEVTMVIAGHRLSAIRHCDQIIYLEGGQIVEQGTHESLMQQRGKYYQIWQLQHKQISEDREEALTGLD